MAASEMIKYRKITNILRLISFDNFLNPQVLDEHFQIISDFFTHVIKLFTILS